MQVCIVENDEQNLCALTFEVWFNINMINTQILKQLCGCNDSIKQMKMFGSHKGILGIRKHAILLGDVIKEGCKSISLSCFDAEVRQEIK